MRVCPGQPQRGPSPMDASDREAYKLFHPTFQLAQAYRIKDMSLKSFEKGRRWLLNSAGRGCHRQPKLTPKT